MPSAVAIAAGNAGRQSSAVLRGRRYGSNWGPEHGGDDGGDFRSDAARAVRASILEGKPTLPCDNCSFASDLPLADFIQDIHEWQGGMAAARESDVQASIWPDLLGIAQHPVTVENACLTHSEGIASLNETASHGLHRVMVL